jgi:hypothetical protein
MWVFEAAEQRRGPGVCMDVGFGAARLRASLQVSHHWC